jgi:hypothetical protein
MPRRSKSGVLYLSAIPYLQLPLRVFDSSKCSGIYDARVEIITLSERYNIRVNMYSKNNTVIKEQVSSSF